MSEIEAAHTEALVVQPPQEDHVSVASSADLMSVVSVTSRSLLSHLLFLFGSICFLVTAIWDEIEFEMDYYEDDEEDESYDENEFCTIHHPQASIYLSISVLGSLFYLGDALTSISGVHGHSRGIATPARVVLRCSIGFTFGVAASFDLVAAIMDDPECPYLSYKCSVAAVYLYLIFAILELSSRKGSFCSEGEMLVSLGDMLFLLGSVADVGDSFYWNSSTTMAQWKQANTGNLIASSLWFVDSILYMMADYCPGKAALPVLLEVESNYELILREEVPESPIHEESESSGVQ